MTSSGVARGREFPRKTLHLTTAVVPIGLWAGVPQRAVAAALVMLFGVACGVEVGRRHSPAFATWFNNTVGAMLRPREAANGVTGATWLLAAFALACLAAPLHAAIAATWAGAVGDGAATIVGRAWSRRRASTGKTLAGSLSCATATALGALMLAGAGGASAVAVGVVAAAAERPAVDIDDNVRVTLTVALAALLLRI